MAIRKYYFRATDGSLLGPYNLNTVAELVRAQRVRANTPVSIDGQNFQPTKTLPELAILLSVDAEGIAPPDEVDEAMVEERLPTYSGSFADVSFPKMLFHFFASRATGRLLVNNQALKKEFFLEGGKLIAANSNLKRDQLGQHLVRVGRFDQQRMEQLLQQARAARMRLGDYLLQQKLIDAHELYRLLVEQLKEKILEVFEWRTGGYAFFNGERYEGSLLPINQSPWELLAEGVRRGYRLKELEELFQPYLNRLLLPKENPQLHVNQLALLPLEQKVLREASQQRTLARLLERLGENDEKRRIVLYCIYLFLELELLVIGPEAENAFGDELPGEELPGSLDWEAEVGAAPAKAPVSAIQTTPPTGRAEQNLLEKLNQLKGQDFFARLGLERSATSADVAKAFIKEARKYHPDQLPPDASESLRELSSQVFALLNEAQEKLGNDNSRREYLAALEAGLKDEQIDVSHILEAESCFQLGQRLLAARKYPAALEAFEKAVKLNPEEGEFQVYRGFAMFINKPGADQRHLKLCEEAILGGLKKRGGELASAFLFLGLIKKQSGDIDTARKMFRKAISLDGNLTEAKRELRLLEMRDEKKGGLFRRK